MSGPAFELVSVCVSACDCWHVCICMRVCARAYELTSAFFVVVEVALSRGDVGEGGVYVRGAEMGKAKGAELIDNKFCCHLYLCQNTAGGKDYLADIYLGNANLRSVFIQ